MYRPNRDQMRVVIAIDASAKDNIESDCNAVSVIGYCDQDVLYTRMSELPGGRTFRMPVRKGDAASGGDRFPVLVEAKGERYGGHADTPAARLPAL